MSDINSLVMSLDYAVLVPVGIGATAIAGFIAYKILASNKKTKKEIPENQDNQFDIPTEPIILTEGISKDDPQEKQKISKEDNLFSELLTEAQESRLNENTINDFNSNFSTEEKLNEHQQETIENIPTLTEEFFPENKKEHHLFEKEVISQTINTTSSDEQVIISTEDSAQPNQLSEQEQIFHALQQQSEKADIVQFVENQQYEHIVNQEIANLQSEQPFGVAAQETLTTHTNTPHDNSILEHFGDLADVLHEEGQPHANRHGDKNITSCDVWVNYMCMKNGKMNLQNLFVNLSSPWGTIDAISNLKEHVEKEVGLDSFGNKQSWAIISVLPIKS